MRFTPTKIIISTALTAILFAGCQPTKPFYLTDRGDLSHYIDRATDIEYPDVEIASLDEVNQAPRPITVIDPEFSSYMDMTLEQCVSVSLQNSKVLRGYGTPNLQGTRVAAGVDNLANNPQAAGTFYNVAVRESEPGFIGTPGQLSNPASVLTNTALDVNQGVESALADFDTQFTAGVFWGTNDEPRNTAPDGNFLNPEVFVQDSVTWQAEFAKKTANGTQLFFRNTNQWTENNNPLVADGGLQQLDSFYRTALEFEVRQPLLRGRGAFIQRAPIVISRIGTDQEIANLEAQLQNMVTNVEIRYWDLHCAYRAFGAASKGRDAALETWRIVADQFEEGADVNIQQVAQAKEQYHFFEGQVIDAYNNLLTNESNLRWLMGLATTDCRVVRPIDEPTTAPVEFDWCSTLDESLTYRPELRQQRWEVKKRQLAIAYSKNALLPELDVTALYRWLGLGNRFGTSNSDALGFPDATSGAIDDLYSGDFQEFSLGIDYRIPIGLRRELSNVRNAQLKLARDVARLEDMELDVTREISEAVRALDANRRLMQSAFNRWQDTLEEIRHFEEIVKLGLETLDVALNAQRRNTEAASAFYTALCEYNKLIALLHRRKGTILAYNGIQFAEGQWSGKAYQDASENARRRSASRPINYGYTRPGVISQGSIYPPAGNTGAPGSVGTPIAPTGGVIGQPISTPYYDSGSSVIEPLQITPAFNNGSVSKNEVQRASLQQVADAGSRAIVPPFVQQVNYEEPVKRTSRRSKSKRKTKKSRQPKTTRTIQAVADANRPVKRIPSRQAVQQPVAQPMPPTQPVIARAMNWEQFGLTRPANAPATAQAAIREHQ